MVGLIIMYKLVGFNVYFFDLLSEVTSCPCLQFISPSSTASNLYCILYVNSLGMIDDKGIKLLFNNIQIPRL